MRSNRSLWLSWLLCLITVACASARSGPIEAYTLSPGASRAYELSLVTEVSSGAGPKRSTTLRGRLNMRVLPDAPRPMLGVQLSALQVDIAGQAQAVMERAFAKPFVIEIDASGRFGESWFLQDTPPADRAAVDAALRSLQIVLSERSQKQWQVHESDQTGEFVATYHSEPGELLTKTKGRYISLRQRQLEPRILESQLRASLDRSHLWLRRLEGHERIELSARGQSAVAVINAHVSLNALPHAPEKTLALWRSDLLRAASAPRDAVLFGADSAWDQAKLDEIRKQFERSGTTFAGVFSALKQGDGSAPEQLVSYLRAFPVQSGELLVRLDELGDSQQAFALNALERAGTPQAQLVLTRIVGDGARSESTRLRALSALSGVKQPAAEALDELITAIRAERARPKDSLSATALLTLGTLAARAPDREATRVRAALQDELNIAPDSARQALALRALSHAQASLASAQTKQYLTSPAQEVREAAVMIVATQRDQRATHDLLELLAHEEDLTVRSAALRGLVSQPPSERANSAIADAVASGQASDPDLRAELVAYLARGIREQPSNQTLLRKQLEQETDRRVLLTILNGPGWRR